MATAISRRDGWRKDKRGVDYVTGQEIRAKAESPLLT